MMAKVEFVEHGGQQSVRRVGGRAPAGVKREERQEVQTVHRVQNEACDVLVAQSVVQLAPF
jgi:hypothetical protein